MEEARGRAMLGARQAQAEGRSQGEALAHTRAPSHAQLYISKLEIYYVWAPSHARPRPHARPHAARGARARDARADGQSPLGARGQRAA